MRNGMSTVAGFTGAILAFCVGAGFATGQEVSQFFVSHGYWGIGGALIALTVYMYMCGSLTAAGRSESLTAPSHVFRYFLGRRLGRVVEWYAALVLFLIFVVMLAGAGAVFEDYYDVPNWIGRIVILGLVLATAVLSFGRIVALLSFLGPVIVIGCLAIAFAGIYAGFGELTDGNSIRMVADTLTKANDSWWLSGILYASFTSIPLAVFLTALGATADHARLAARSGTVGGLAFGAAALAVTVGMLANVRVVQDESVPLLALVRDLVPFLGPVFAVVLLAGIYTTTTPLLWTVARNFADDGTARMNAVVIGLGVLGFVVAFTPFPTLLNLIYPASGWLGIGFLLSIVVSQLRNRRAAIRHDDVSFGNSPIQKR